MSKKKKAKGSTHGGKHPYMRQEKWSDGTLAFWNTPNHKQEAYQDFYNRMCKEAGKLGKM